MQSTVIHNVLAPSLPPSLPVPLLAERDAPRHVQAVNLEAKKPTFQQKMDLELPMSPIEKPSFLDLMDTSNMSLYHDLPRVSTEKVPPRHCASSRFGVVSDEATDGNPGVAGPGVARPDVAGLAFTVAHKHTRPSRPQHKPAEPTHHLAATTLQNKHITKRQILDSEVKLTCTSHVSFQNDFFLLCRLHLSLKVSNYPMSEPLPLLLMVKVAC